MTRSVRTESQTRADSSSGKLSSEEVGGLPEHAHITTHSSASSVFLWFTSRPSLHPRWMRLQLGGSCLGGWWCCPYRAQGLGDGWAGGG